MYRVSGIKLFPRVGRRLAVLALLVLPFAVSAQAQQVVISQVYGGGGNSGAPLKNDYIELFNIGSTDVSLAGWSVQYASAAGTTWAVTNITGTLHAGQYYLVQEAAGANLSAAALQLPMQPVPSTCRPPRQRWRWSARRRRSVALVPLRAPLTWWALAAPPASWALGQRQHPAIPPRSFAAGRGAPTVRTTLRISQPGHLIRGIAPPRHICAVAAPRFRSPTRLRWTVPPSISPIR